MQEAYVYRVVVQCIHCWEVDFMLCTVKPVLETTCISPLSNGKILDWSKLKAFADDKINVAEMMISLSDMVENIVGKGENAGYQYFLLCPQCFQMPSLSGSLKVGLCGKELSNPLY